MATQDKGWTKIKPYGAADEYTVWVSGVYKIVSYRAGEYLAFFIREGFQNWGDHVCTPPDDLKFGKGWKTLKAAMTDCGKHAQWHAPSAYTVKRSLAIKEAMIEEEKAA